MPLPGERIGPGLYLDEGNHLHLDVPELLRLSGYADTPENCEVLTQAALRMVKQLYPNVPAHVVEDR